MDMFIYELQKIPVRLPATNETALISNLAAHDNKTFSDVLSVSKCETLNRVFVCSPTTIMIIGNSSACTLKSALHREQTRGYVQLVKQAGVLTRRVGKIWYQYVPLASLGSGRWRT